MRTQNIKRRIVFGLILVFTLSCREQLEIAPISSLSVASFWKTPDDANGALAGMYTELRQLATRDLFFMGELRSGEFESAPIRNAIGYIDYFQNAVTAATATMGWQQPYKIISSANLIIANVPGIPFGSDAAKNSIMAQAYTMRAYMYFVLARTWGDVPLIREPLKDFSSESTFISRTPVDQVFGLIKSDLETALALFPDNSFPPGRVKWSKPAANMLKGKVYLWTAKQMDGGTEDLNTALAAFEEVKTADVQLLDNYASIFDYNNKGNKEVIFAIHYDQLEGGNNFYYNPYLHFSQLLTTNQATRDKLVPGGNGVFSPAKYIIDQFAEDDERKDATFQEIYTYSGGDSTYLSATQIKYNGLVVGSSRMFIDDVILYRYADLLLLIAETKNALGQDPSAEMNLVRERAYDDNFDEHVFVSGSKEENDVAILQERLFELYLEGSRWWDLVRFGKAYELVPSLQGRENDIPLLFPVPEQTLTRNSSLTQTPGW